MGLHVSLVQAFPSSQLSAVPSWHLPSTGVQVSRPLHTSLSEQSPSVEQHPWIAVFAQPEAGLQVSAVQTTASSQEMAVCEQAPVAGAQESSVQAS